MKFTEVIKVDNGRFCNLSAHLQRMSTTVRHFFGCDIDTCAIAEELLPPTMRSGVVKCRVVYGEGIFSIEFDSYAYRKIEKLALVEAGEIDYRYKYEDRSDLTHLMSRRGDADDILIVRDGLITDTSFSNVALRADDGMLYTPDTYLLAGTKRALLLQSGVIRSRRIAVDDLTCYSEIYLINAMIDIEDRITAQVAFLH